MTGNGKKKKFLKRVFNNRFGDSSIFFALYELLK